jgi:hypothetical protein
MEKIPYDLAEDLLRWHKGETETEWRRALRVIGNRTGGGDVHIYLATVAIDTIGVIPGDVIVVADPKDRPKLFGRLREVTIDGYAALREIVYNRDCMPIEITPAGFNNCWRRGLKQFIRDRRRWGLRKKVWGSHVAIVTPWPDERVDPIEAPDADGALTKLLASVGCRMPETRAGANK